MKNLFNEQDAIEILHRIDSLQPTAVRLWGKMNVAQMLAHCSEHLEVATGNKVWPRTIVGYLFGGFMKKYYSNDKIFTKNSPTGKHYIISDNRNFEEEKKRLKLLVQKFQTGGESNCASHPHSFFGKLTPTEWSIGMYKHLDHHLRQFSS